jgi:hypothetical protein
LFADQKISRAFFTTAREAASAKESRAHFFQCAKKFPREIFTRDPREMKIFPRAQEKIR